MKNNPKLFPKPESSVLVVIDIQEKLIKAMDKAQIASSIKRSEILIDSCIKLKVPVVFTEQYSKGLGPTVEELKGFLPLCDVFEKSTFSCFGNKAFSDRIKELNPETIIICGIETHVCVQQTAFDAMSSGCGVVIPADAVCSRSSQNKDIALNLMLSSGVAVTSTESLIFALIKDSTHPSFKEISKKLK
ncbi:MAG TPA: isochorismatase family protein [Victivallales bacterium]|nr:isochorismatase family protein [Victivallales bacterium]